MTFDGHTLHATAGQGSLDRGYAATVAGGGQLQAVEVAPAGRRLTAT